MSPALPTPGTTDGPPTDVFRSGIGSSISRSPDPWQGGLHDPWQSEPNRPETPGALLDSLVDAVVERIEERVLDELERRGRRDWRVY